MTETMTFFSLPKDLRMVVYKKVSAKTMLNKHLLIRQQPYLDDRFHGHELQVALVIGPNKLLNLHKYTNGEQAVSSVTKHDRVVCSIEVNVFSETVKLYLWTAIGEPVTVPHYHVSGPTEFRTTTTAHQMMVLLNHDVSALAGAQL